MSDPEAFSAANDVFAVLSWSIFFGVVLFLARTFRRPGWYSRDEVQAFLALALYFGAVGIGRVWSAYLLYERPVGAPIFIDASFRPVTVSYFAAILGALCFVRVTYPAAWGNWPWVLALAAAVAVAAALRWM